MNKGEQIPFINVTDVSNQKQFQQKQRQNSQEKLNNLGDNINKQLTPGVMNIQGNQYKNSSLNSQNFQHRPSKSLNQINVNLFSSLDSQNIEEQIQNHQNTSFSSSSSSPSSSSEPSSHISQKQSLNYRKNSLKQNQKKNDEENLGLSQDNQHNIVSNSLAGQKLHHLKNIFQIDKSQNNSSKRNFKQVNRTTHNNLSSEGKRSSKSFRTHMSFTNYKDQQIKQQQRSSMIQQVQGNVLTIQYCQGCSAHTDAHSQYSERDFYNMFVRCREKIVQIMPFLKVEGVKSSKTGNFVISYKENVIFSKQQTGHFPNLQMVAQMVHEYISSHYYENKTKNKKKGGSMNNSMGLFLSSNQLSESQQKQSHSSMLHIGNFEEHKGGYLDLNQQGGGSQKNLVFSQKLNRKSQEFVGDLDGNEANKSNQSNFFVQQNHLAFTAPYQSSNLQKKSSIINQFLQQQQSNNTMFTTPQKLPTNIKVQSKTTQNSLKNSQTNVNNNNNNNNQKSSLFQPIQSTSHHKRVGSEFNSIRPQSSKNLNQTFAVHKRESQFSSQKHQSFLDPQQQQMYQKDEELLQNPQFLIPFLEEKIEDFWNNYKLYYLSFQFNPSFKRITADIQAILNQVCEKLNGVVNSYNQKDQEHAEAMQNYENLLKQNQELQNGKQLLEQKNTSLMHRITDLNEKIGFLDAQVSNYQLNEEACAEMKEKYEDLSKQNLEFQSLLKMQQLQAETAGKEMRRGQREAENIQKVHHLDLEKLQKEKRAMKLRELGLKVIVRNKRENIEKLKFRIDQLQYYIKEEKEIKVKLSQDKNQQIQDLQKQKRELETYQKSTKQFQMLYKAVQQNLRNNLHESTNKIEQLEENLKKTQTKLKALALENDKSKFSMNGRLKFGVHHAASSVSVVSVNSFGDIDEIWKVSEGSGSSDDVFQSKSEGEFGIYDQEFGINFDKLPAHISMVFIVVCFSSDGQSSRGDQIQQQQSFGSGNNLMQQQQQQQSFSKKGAIHIVENNTISNIFTIPKQNASMMFVPFLICRDTENQYMRLDEVNIQSELDDIVLFYQEVVVKTANIKLTANQIAAQQWTVQNPSLISIKQFENIGLPPVLYYSYGSNKKLNNNNNTNSIKNSSLKQNSFNNLTKTQSILTCKFNWQAPIQVTFSLLCFDAKNQLVENLSQYFKTSKDGAIKNCGNQTNKEYDAHASLYKIEFNLAKLQLYATSQVFMVMTVKESGKTFDSVDKISLELEVKGCGFAKMDIGIVRDQTRNGLLLGDLYRVGQKWTIKRRAYFVKDISNDMDFLPYIENIRKGNYSGLKNLR